MASRTQVILTDDIDGGEAAETVTFALDGSSYEIDLSSENAERLRSIIEEYAGSARKAGGTGRRGSTAPRTATPRPDSGVNPSAVRAWASANNITVSPRGRIASKVVEAFKAAGN